MIWQGFSASAGRCFVGLLLTGSPLFRRPGLPVPNFLAAGWEGILKSGLGLFKRDGACEVPPFFGWSRMEDRLRIMYAGGKSELHRARYNLFSEQMWGPSLKGWFTESAAEKKPPSACEGKGERWARAHRLRRKSGPGEPHREQGQIGSLWAARPALARPTEFRVVLR